ncbi:MULTISPECIES: adenylate/guanylate cyclase domain-containing protein [unclassified Coleofasciculus]|uniref:adenylate/guanylate cyclase domain-containing protein n=1 Tax=unclassified Coleofasciculus TaxID=2692782 RepID=UPI00187F4F0F|nr:MULTISPECIES: adenylate/guanylate cyclase domain-containing protein [unclassified Coleofasciculus]MBE9126457.1 PAS domain S-box protein [Coleofasciculus sp. LEGE 07081]MBE9148895.1 PAS domain S-box protein [Coleofasciculus sp. LEGE 07092]
MSTLLSKLLSLLAPRRREYLIVNREFKILEKSLGVQRFVDCPDELVQGKDVRVSLPELIGLETILIDILEEREVSFELKGVGRGSEPNKPLYVDFYIIKNNLAFYDRTQTLANQLIILLEDVTEQMVLEQSLVQATNESNLLLINLEASKAYIDKIISSMADALLVTTSSGQIKTVNYSVQDLFGYSETELVGKPISLILNKGDLLPTTSQQNSIGDKAFTNREVVCQTKTGEKIIVAFSCSVIQTEIEGVKNFIYIGRDITERQRNQKRIAMQYAATRIISESATVSDAIPKILQAIGESLEWDLGEFWILDKATNWTRRIPSSQSPLPNPQVWCIETWVRVSVTDPAFLEMTRKADVGFPSRIWATNSPQWVSDIMQESGRELSPASGITQLHGAFGFPIRDEEEILGVITFYSHDIQRPDLDLLQVLAAMGSQFGEFIKRKKTETALRQEQEKSEQLLLNILPEPIAERLKQEQCIIADDFPEVTVLFADIVGFTQLASSIHPIALLGLLNQIFSAFDRLCEQYSLEKIKTIGDAYMVVGGLPRAQPKHAEAIAAMALDMQATIAQFQSQTGETFSMRIGINTGPVVAGVIGIKKFSYDLWGDTVNTASRMESQGLPAHIQVTAATYERLKKNYQLQERGVIDVKGKGQMTTYFLLGKKVD